MTLEVAVVSPEREVWSGEAEMVIAKGTAGDVGILKGHAPMLIALAVAPVRVKIPEGERVILCDGGFLHVTQTTEGATRVDVLAEHAALPEEIDVAAARAHLEELQRRRQEGGEAEATAAIARATMRVEHGRG